MEKLNIIELHKRKDIKESEKRRILVRYVRDFLTEQGGPAKGPPGKPYLCAYKAPDGKMCAVGCLIPDEEYRPELEGESVDSLITISTIPSEELKKALRFFNRGNLLGHLQDAHDEETFWRGDFEKDFKYYLKDL